MSRWRGLKIEAEGTGISLELSQQINLLGEMLGQVIQEEAGERVLAMVEELRRLCKRAAAENQPSLRDEAGKIIAGLELGEIVWLLRSFTTFFHLANQAEQHEIVRINRERTNRPGGDSGRPESIDVAIAYLKKAGLNREGVLNLLGQLDIEPTLTAHPTEARRRSILDKQRAISAFMSRLGACPAPSEEDETLEGLYAQISLLFATDEVRAERPTVDDEVAQGLYFLQGTIWEMIPRVHRDLERALRRHYGDAPSIEPFLRYRSWIGGDRDGNPTVTAAVTRRTLRAHRIAALSKHLEELHELRTELSVSDRRAPVPKALYDSIAADLEDVGLPETRLRQYKFEPYRLKLSLMIQRIEALLAETERGSHPGSMSEHRVEAAAPASRVGSSKGYNGLAYRADLDLLDSCLRESGFGEVAENGRLARARVLAASFGFHLAALDVRQHSRVHERTVTELLRRAKVESNYSDLPEAAKVAVLSDELLNPRPLVPPGPGLSDESQEVLDTFRLIEESLQAEPSCISSYVVSMTHAASDLLEPLLLAKEVGLWTEQEGAPIDFVPLFETIDDLDGAEERVGELFRQPLYRQQLSARGNFQEIMLGYSDSNKDGGYWMANWALHAAQEKIGRACKQAGIGFRLFHGRGGTVGRGGGRAGHAILAMPPEVRNGKIRITEQGEVISFRYGLAEIAHRHIEQVVHAMIIAQTARPDPATANHDLMVDVAQRSKQVYRELIDSPDFWPWYVRVTPIEQISRLPIASRPVAREGGTDVDFEALRAIPWVFAWTQARYLVPGWYAVGTALQEVIGSRPDTLEVLRQMYQGWDFFRAVIDNAARELARTRVEISERYARLAAETEPDPGFHDRIVDEYRKTREALIAITRGEDLLDDSPVIKKSIVLRNPYTDVLNLLQIELLRRYRTSDEEGKQRLRIPLFLSINGIAAAMQSTG